VEDDEEEEEEEEEEGVECGSAMMSPYVYLITCEQLKNSQVKTV